MIFSSWRKPTIIPFNQPHIGFCIGLCSVYWWDIWITPVFWQLKREVCVEQKCVITCLFPCNFFSWAPHLITLFSEMIYYEERLKEKKKTIRYWGVTRQHAVKSNGFFVVFYVPNDNVLIIYTKVFLLSPVNWTTALKHMHCRGLYECIMYATECNRKFKLGCFF